MHNTSYLEVVAETVGFFTVWIVIIVPEKLETMDMGQDVVWCIVSSSLLLFSFISSFFPFLGEIHTHFAEQRAHSSCVIAEYKDVLDNSTFIYALV